MYRGVPYFFGGPRTTPSPGHECHGQSRPPLTETAPVSCAVVCRVVCTNHRCCGDFWRESHGLQSHAPGLKSSTPLNSPTPPKAGRPGLSPAPRSVGGTPASLTASPLVNLLPHNPKLPSGAPAHPTAPRRTASADLSGNVNGNVEAAARI